MPPFESGFQLGPYEIQSPIGAGGMGEVYKARDTRLNRFVAIKVLPEHVSKNPESKQRFEREAQTLASLSHPHICPIFDVGKQDGVDYIVMEFLEGQTLADRLAKGALTLDQALKIGSEIADGLDQAHRHGITHRDLKPGNIMLTKGGVKLLDFGLAKLRPSEGISTFSAAPTNAEVTAQGMILGTLQYMSPEQLEGGEADARTDIFAFGSVLYEMITGRKAFEGKTQMSLISSILRDRPRPLSELQPVTPPMLDHIIATCLAKDPDERWQTARDLCRELKWVSENSVADREQIEEKSKAKSLNRLMPYLIGGIAGAVIIAIGASFFGPTNRGSAASVVRLAIPLPPQQELNLFGIPMALSPDGTLLAYAGGNQLYLRRLDSLESKPLPGTEGAFGPFFSPDGTEIGFSTTKRLKKVSIAGGAPVTLCECPPAPSSAPVGEPMV